MWYILNRMAKIEDQLSAATPKSRDNRCGRRQRYTSYKRYRVQQNIFKQIAGVLSTMQCLFPEFVWHKSDGGVIFKQPKRFTNGFGVQSG